MSYIYHASRLSFQQKTCKDRHGIVQVHEAEIGPGDEVGSGAHDARTGAGQRGTHPRVPSSGPHQVDRPLLALQAGLVEGL